METCHKPGNLTCPEVGDLLSDLIDARRGEIPHPDGTRLSESGVRAAVELHLAGCNSCKDELACLESIGSVYADFAVGEAPAQQFHDYGSKIRARLQRESHEAEAEPEFAPMDCAEVQPLLSDLIDIRRGEAPPSSLNRERSSGGQIAGPALYSAAELHLTGCESCQAELSEMEEVGAAFAEFDVDRHSEEHFEQYGKTIRERMANESAAVPVQGRFGARNPFSRRLWVSAAVSGLVAAGVLMLLRPNRGTLVSDGPGAGVVSAEDARAERIRARNRQRNPLSSPAPRIDSRMEVLVPDRSNGNNPLVNIENASIKSLAQLPPEGQVGFFVMGERSLLGAYLKTTRDDDRIVGQELGGLKVYGVVPNSPAEAMGLQKDDYILNVNDLDVKHGGAQEAWDLLSYIQKHGEGTPVTLLVIRKEGSNWVFLKPLQGVLGKTENTTKVLRRPLNF